MSVSMLNGPPPPGVVPVISASNVADWPPVIGVGVLNVSCNVNGSAERLSDTFVFARENVPRKMGVSVKLSNRLPVNVSPYWLFATGLPYDRQFEPKHPSVVPLI